MTIQVTVEGEIRLDQFLKWAQVTSTGGQSKALILSGLVKVNGELETRRGRVLHAHDRVRVEEKDYEVHVKEDR